MKTIQKSFLFCSFLLCFMVVNAQIKVETNGRVQVGVASANVNDADNAASFQVFGKSNLQTGAGSKLTFGDFGTYANIGWNVFIGEYGTGDTDQLWLQGKMGTYFTYGNSSYIWGYYDANVGNRFNFNCDVYSSGLKLTSDERLKENIRPLSGSLFSLEKLNGVSYNLKNPNEQTITDDSVKLANNTAKMNNDLSTLSDKEKRDKVFFEKWDAEL